MYHSSYFGSALDFKTLGGRETPPYSVPPIKPDTPQPQPEPQIEDSTRLPKGALNQSNFGSSNKIQPPPAESIPIQPSAEHNAEVQRSNNIEMVVICHC